MSLLRTEQIPNGDVMVPYRVYKCDYTGQEIPEQYPHVALMDNTVHLSQESIHQLFFEVLKSQRGAGIVPYILYELIDRFRLRKKRKTYLDAELKKVVLLKFNHRCVKCGSSEQLTIDHILAVANGGTDTFTNLQVLCKPCNSSKGIRSNQEFMKTTRK